MQSPDFLRRMETVLASRVEEKKREDAPAALTALRAAGAVPFAMAFFFFLKAVALAGSGGHSFAAPLTDEAGVAAHLHHWFAGADPVTRTIAVAIRPDMRLAILATL
ncbi:MAG: hypothetical protein H6898_05345 [Rhodobacter sp.]|nr:hypothetical protein [Paracoccaceae bacterium]MCC0075997.1 hypothetical protein [Rhodobacter sp.]